MSEKHPHASHYKDRHGTTRWRYRRDGKTTPLPGKPGDAAFEAAYIAAVAGIKPQKAEVRRHPSATVPESLRSAWNVITRTSIEWKKLRPISRYNQAKLAERFFATPVVEGSELVYGDVQFKDLERRHVKQIVGRWHETPHTASHILRLLRKLCGVALDEEWIKSDPTYRVNFRPDYEGWRAWTQAERTLFEKKWPVGSTPRLVYALALYTGHRRADLVQMKPGDMRDGGIVVVQQKTGTVVWLPILPELQEALDAADLTGETILRTQYGLPYSDKALGMRMQEWTAAAGMGSGATLHGLRKTLGKMLAEGGATTRQIMDVLGHKSIAHAELYSREAEQKKLARDGMNRLVKLRVVKGGEPAG